MAKYSSTYSTVLRYAPLSFLTYWLQPFLYPMNQNRDYTPFWTTQFSNAFYPWLDIGQDFTETFKRYRAPKTNGFFSNLFQPLFGIGNVLKGLLLLTVLAINIPFALLGTVFKLLLTPILLLPKINMGFLGIYKSDNYLKVMSRDIQYKYGVMISSLIDGINQLIRGASQILFTPLTWLLKMPLRGILSGIHAYREFTAKANASDAPPLDDLAERTMMAQGLTSGVDTAVFQGYNSVYSQEPNKCYTVVIGDKDKANEAIESVLKQKDITVFNRYEDAYKAVFRSNTNDLQSDKQVLIIEIDQVPSIARNASDSKQNINEQLFDKFTKAFVYTRENYLYPSQISVNVKNGQLLTSAGQSPSPSK